MNFCLSPTVLVAGRFSLVYLSPAERNLCTFLASFGTGAADSLLFLDFYNARHNYIIVYTTCDVLYSVIEAQRSQVMGELFGKRRCS